jgi:hypothetical protein
MHLAKTSQICSFRQHHLDVNGREILQAKTFNRAISNNSYLHFCNSLDAHNSNSNEILRCYNCSEMQVKKPHFM